MTFSLSALDSPPNDPVVGDVWRRSHAALRDVQPAVARWIEGCEPRGLTPVAALDGFPTYRLAGDPPRWYAGTAVPLERARPLVDSYYPGELNATLPSLGSGAELTLLLERLGPRKAVFVFEPDPEAVVAVLRRVDVSRDLARLRCILVPPLDVDAFLLQLLDAHPGLLPPGNILRVWGVTEARLASLRDTCVRVAAEIGARRDRRTEHLLAAPPPPRDPARLAIVAWSDDPRAVEAAEGIQTQCGALGHVRAFCAAGPADVHPLGCLERLAEFAPALCVSVSGGPARLPTRAPVCEWHVSIQPSARLDPQRTHAAASPRIESSLRNRDPRVRVIPFYWAAPATRACPPADPRGPLLVVSEAAGASAAAPPDLPTHRLVADRMRALVESPAALGQTPCGDVLVARAERDARLRLPPDVRAQLAAHADDVLIPAQELRTIWSEARAAAECVAVGMGWSLVSGSDPGRQVWPWRTFVNSGLAPRGAVFAHAADPLTPPLVEAAAAGWPIALHRHDPRGAAAALGGVLVPGAHLSVFSTCAELRAWLNRLRDEPDGLIEMARRAAAYVHAEHSWSQRVAGLRSALSIPSIGSAS